MSYFICPVCGGELHSNGKSLSCALNHSFDLAKSGYVNLLGSQQPKTRRHGDDRLMVRARRDFLNKGYYQPLLEGIRKALEPHVRNGCTILDAGCGECWYTSGLYAHLIDHGIAIHMLGVDISKDALAEGAKRNRELELAVASIFHLPVADASCEVVLSLFAPFAGGEFYRVLKPGGILLKVIPLEKHLLRLKQAVYDRVYENSPEDTAPEGFLLLERQALRDTIHLQCREDILHVFTMTPYYYKTGVKDQKKLELLRELDTEIEFGIFIYQKAK